MKERQSNQGLSLFLSYSVLLFNYGHENEAYNNMKNV